MSPISIQPVNRGSAPHAEPAAEDPSGSGSRHAEALRQIYENLRGREHQPAELERAIEGLDRLIADLTADRDALSSRLQAINSPMSGVPQEMLERVVRFVDFATLKALRLTTKQFEQIVNLQVRKLSVESRITSDRNNFSREEQIPAFSDLPSIVEKFPHLEKLDLSETRETVTAQKLMPLERLPSLRELVIPHFSAFSDAAVVQLGVCDQLAKLTQLERLTTPWNVCWANMGANYSLRDDLLLRLAPLKQIRELPYMRLATVQGLKQLGEFSGLKKIKLLVPDADDGKLDALAQSISRLSLEEFSASIGSASVSQNGLQRLQHALKNVKGSIELDVSGLPREFPENVLQGFASALSIECIRVGAVWVFIPAEAAPQ